MINYQKDDFDGTLDDIMKSVNELLENTGDGFETKEEEEKKNRNGGSLNETIRSN